MAIIIKDNERFRLKVEIPHEPGEWIILTDLTWSDLEDAKDVRIRQVMREAVNMPNLDEAVAAAARKAAEDDIEKAKRDPLNEYDVMTILKRSIVGWSYGYEPIEEYIPLLDRKTKDWILEIIVQRNFLTVEEGEASAKI